MARLRTLTLALLTVAIVAVGAILGLGVHWLPTAGDLQERYRAAGAPTRITDLNPGLVAALDAERPHLAYDLARSECGTPERRLARHGTVGACMLAAKVAYPGDSLRLWWLNSAYFGRAAYGVAVGSLNWFGKDQRNLAPAEAALLVALTRAPTADMDRLRRMLDRVADRMQIPEDARGEAIAAIVERR